MQGLEGLIALVCYYNLIGDTRVLSCLYLQIGIDLNW